MSDLPKVRWPDYLIRLGLEALAEKIIVCIILKKWIHLNRIKSIEILKPHVKVFGLLNQQYVFKSYERSTHSFEEIKNLKELDKISSLPIPKFYGSYDKYFLQAYVQGIQVMKHLKSLSEIESIHLLKKMVATLHQIQVSVDSCSNEIKSRKKYSQRNVLKRLHRNWNFVREYILSHSNLTEMHKDIGYIHEFVEYINVDCLSLESGMNVTIHGDYKADNILITTKGELMVVDWLSMAYGPPWHDLAALLEAQNELVREEILEYYLGLITNTISHLHITMNQAGEYLRHAVIFKIIDNLQSHLSGRSTGWNLYTRLPIRINALKKEISASSGWSGYDSSLSS